MSRHLFELLVIKLSLIMLSLLCKAGGGKCGPDPVGHGIFPYAETTYEAIKNSLCTNVNGMDA